MHFFNYTFTPFGILLVLFAVLFSTPEKKDTIISITTLIVQFIVNFYLLKNIYHFKNPNHIRLFLILFNILTTSIVFYFITAYWSPSWLLYSLPPALGATFLNRAKTIIISFISVLSMFSVYWLRGYILGLEISMPIWTMAISNGLFIIVLAVFINNMSDVMIKLRTIAR